MESALANTNLVVDFVEFANAYSAFITFPNEPHQLWHAFRLARAPHLTLLVRL